MKRYLPCGAAGFFLQHHRILRLPRKVTVMPDPCHIWNVIYNARNNRCHPPTSPNTAPVTQKYFQEWSSSRMKRYLPCGAAGFFLQHHRILRLPRKVTVMPDPCHIWNVIYNARNNRCHPPTSPNTAPATQNDCHDWSSSHMKRYLFTMRGTTDGILQHHRILVLPGKLTLETFTKISRKNSWNVIYNTRPIREWSEQDPRMIRPWLFALTTSIFYWKIQHFALRLSFQISPTAAPATKNDSSTSPNTAPATQSHCHDWSLSHMKRYLQCAEQQVSSSNITEYCACHAKWLSWLILVTYETLFTMRGTTDGILQHHRILRLPRKLTLETFTKISRQQLKRHLQCATDPRMIRAGSEQDPRMIRPWNRQSATRLATEVTFRAHHEHFLLKNTTFRAPAIIPNFTNCCACHEKWQFNITKYCACHAKSLSWLILVTYETLFTMRGTTGVILQHHRILRLPRKMTVMTDPRHIWSVIYMRGTTDGILQHHRILRLPRKLTLENFTKISRKKQLKRHLQCATDPRMIRAGSEQDPRMIRPWNRQSATRLATEVTFRAHHEHFLLKNTTFRAPAIIPNFRKYCACHEKWHLNFTKCCTCHEKWHLNFTKCCACHEKWHFNFTRYCACHEK